MKIIFVKSGYQYIETEGDFILEVTLEEAVKLHCELYNYITPEQLLSYHEHTDNWGRGSYSNEQIMDVLQRIRLKKQVDKCVEDVLT